MSADFPHMACTALSVATSRRLAFLQLRADPLYERMTLAQRNQFVDAALQNGYLLAQAQRVHGSIDPWALAARLRVSVRETKRDAGFGTTVVCAAYHTRSREIELYTPVLERMQARLDRVCAAAPPLHPLLAAPVKDVFLAHEIYHHLDCARGRSSLCHRQRIVLLHLGAWRWTSGVTSLAEIAAGAFAQELLGLAFHAKLLDLFLLQDADNTAAERFVQMLCESGDALRESLEVLA
jgi:hypothetical protein